MTPVSGKSQIPDYLLRHSEKVTDWMFIVEIIERGKHPSNLALAMALGGPKPLPKVVRDYLARRFEHGWPQGGRTKTPWEKMESVGSDWEHIAADDIDDPEKVFEAATEVYQLWLYCQYCGQIDSGKNTKEAVQHIATNMRKMPPGWPSYDEGTLLALCTSYDYTNKKHRDVFAQKKLNDLITEASEEHHVSYDRLESFFRAGNDRYDFR
jgi:hypothetical protein